MSNVVDNKVVSMEFDNRNFENNVQTSLGTLNKLKGALNLTDSAKGLDRVSESARKIDLSGLGNAVDTVKAKFSALEVMGMTAMMNITNSAINHGKRIVNALKIDPIRTGFQEYETQINSVQTILSNTRTKGTTIDDVNKALDELNLYADKTIYNFQEMTRNVGTFTAAGVDLKTSVSAIKGIANLAAVSGSNSEQASRAMYQLSQALSSGTVKLQDWNSVVNAGMGGQVFQDALKETARVHGIEIDEMIKKEGSFRETLQKGWLTSDILTETLNKFTGDLSEAELKSIGYTDKQIKNIQALGKDANDAATKVKTFTQLMDTLKEAAQSGWGQTWRMIIGDFEEARTLWTNVSQVLEKIINGSAEARNKLVKGWVKGGGRDMMLESFKNVFEAFQSVVKPIKEAFREIFPPMTAKRLVSITKSIRDFTAKLKLSSDQAKKVKAIFKGFFSVLDIGLTVVKTIAKAVVSLLKAFLGGSKKVTDLAASFGNWLSKLRDGIKESNIFGKAFDKISSAIQNGINKIKSFGSHVKEAFHSKEIGGFLGVITKIKDAISKIAEKIGSALKAIGRGFLELLKTGDLQKVFNLFNTGVIGAILLNINKFSKGFGSFGKIFGEVKDAVGHFGGTIESIKGILDGVRGCLVAYQKDIKAKALMKIAISIGILAASLLVISTIDSDKMVGALVGITALVLELKYILGVFNKGNFNIKKAAKTVILMLGFSTSIFILAKSLKSIANLGLDEIIKGLAGIGGLMAMMVGVVSLMSSKGVFSKKLVKGMSGLIAFAIAIKLLVSTFKTFKDMSWEEIAKGLVGVSGLIASVVAFMNIAKFQKGTLKTSASIILLAAAIKVLASTFNTFKTLSWEEMAKGLAGVGVLLVELAAFVKVLDSETGFKGIFKMATAMVLMGASMKIFASVVNSLSGINFSSLTKGLIGFAAILASVVSAIRLMPKEGALKAALAITVISTAMLMMAKAISSIGNLSLAQLAKGLVGIAGAMLILVVGLNAVEGTLKGSAALVIAATAIGVLAVSLKIIGSLGIEGLIVSLVGMAGALAILGVSAKLLKPFTGTMLALSAAVLLLGVGCMAAGVGVLAFATGLSTLISVGASGVSSLAETITTILKSVIDLIPEFIKKIGEGFIELCNVIANGAPAIGKAIKAIVTEFLSILKDLVPEIVDGLMEFIIKALDALVENAPTIVDKIFDFLIVVLNKVAERLPELIESVVNVIMAFFEGIVQALGNIDWNTVVQALGGIGIIAALLAALSALALLAPGAMVGIVAVAGVVAELAGVLALFGGLKQIPGLDWLIGEGGKLLENIGNAIGKMIGGFVGGILEGISDSLPHIATKLSEFMTNLTPFVEGASKITPTTMAGVESLARIILVLTATNILDGLTAWFTGGHALDKFAKEIIPFGEAMAQFSDSVSGKVNGSAVAAAAAAGEILVKLAKEVPNEGGLLSWIVGENRIDVFGERLPALAKGISDFSKTVTENPINVQATKTAASIGSILASLAKDIPNEGGLLGLIIGETDWAGFTTNLPLLAKGIAAFSNTIAENPINEKAAKGAAEIGTILTNIAKDIPSSGGLLDIVLGEKQSLSSFANNFESVAKGIVGFSKEIESGGIDEKQAKAAANIGEMLVGLAKDVPSEGGVLDLIFGGKDLATFSEKLPKFASGLASFSKSIDTSDFSQEKTDAVGNMGEMIVSLAKEIPDAGGLWQWIAGGKDIELFGAKLASFAGKMGDYAGKCGDLDFGLISRSIKTFQKLADLANSVSGTDFGGMNSLARSLSNMGKDAVDKFVQAFDPDGYNKAKEAGGKMISGVGEGASSMSWFVTFQLGLIALSGASTIRNYYNSYYSSGSHLVDGLVAGMNDNAYKVEKAGKNLGTSAKKGTQKATEEHSPSKVFYRIGAFAGIGFINGLDHYRKKVEKSGSQLGGSAIRGINKAVAKVRDFIDNEIDSSPVIRPVVDLSDVSSGASLIDGMFSRTPPIGVMSNLGYISNTVGNNQNGNDDVIHAIKDLGRSLEGSSRNTYNLNGITYDDGSAVSDAIKVLIRASKMEKRV